MPCWPAEIFVTWVCQERGLSFAPSSVLPFALLRGEGAHVLQQLGLDCAVAGEHQGRHRVEGVRCPLDRCWSLTQTLTFWQMILRTLRDRRNGGRQHEQLRSRWTSFSRPFQSPLVLQAPSQHPQVPSALRSPRVTYPKRSWTLCYLRSFLPSHSVSLTLDPSKTADSRNNSQGLSTFYFAYGYILALDFLLDYKSLEKRNPHFLNTSHL